ncbi:hypothetical protein OAK35_03810 [Crocinitomicaceae bacterium]|nr:hypothetical protein [Crocinitomicaceae bacterium]
MNRFIILALFFLTVLPAKAQMTNAEVYNFEVGDVLQTSIAALGGPFFYLDTITQKTIVADTVYYTIKRVNLETFGPTIVFVSISQVSKQYILSALTFPLGQGSCLPPIDTMFIGDCGQNVYKQSSSYDSTCFEPNIWYAEWYEGLGGPYAYVDNVVDGIYYETELIYSNTQQWGECGSYSSYETLGIEESTLNQNSIELLKTYDLLGREVNTTTKGIVLQLYSDGSIKKVSQ